MASLGSLVVSLAMDTAKFTGDVGKAAQQMARLTAAASKIGAAVGAAVGAASVATAALVRQSIDAADAAMKQSQAVGMTVEAYTALAYAADLSGVSQDQLGGSLAKLARSAADAAVGTGEAADAFRAMGINVKATDGTLKTTDKLLDEIAEKFSSYRDSAEKTALAQRIFGRSGAALIPLLNAGSKGIAELTEEARKLGVVIGTDVGKQSEIFKDNLSRINAVVNGLANRIAKELLPTLSNLSTELVESAKNSGALDTAARSAATGVRFLLTAGANVAYVFGMVGNEIGGMAAQVAALASGDFKGFSTIGAMMREDAERARKQIDAINAAIWDDTPAKIKAKSEKTGGDLAAPLVVAATKARTAANQIKNDADRIFDQIEGKLRDRQLQVDTQGASDRTRGLIEQIRAGATGDQLTRWLEQQQAIDSFTASVTAAGEAERHRQAIMSEGASLTSSLMTPLEELLAQYERQNELLAAGAINAQTYARAVAKSQEDFAKATEQAAATSDTFAQRASQNIQDFLGESLQSAMEGNFSSIARSFTSMINRMVAEALAADLARSIFGDSLKGGSGGGWVAKAANFASALFGGKAAGGPVSPGRGYLVGERGPEMFVPTTAGTVQPAAAIQGGNTYVVNVTATPGMSRQTAMQQGEQIGRGIQRATARNG